MKLYFERFNKTKGITFLIFIYALSFSMLLAGLHFFHPDKTQTPEQIQKNIADNIIRLHVIANSDSDLDQSLKLKVRDEIIEGLQNTVSSSSSVDGAKQLLISEKDAIRNNALNVIYENGYDYDVNVSLGKRYFPAKSYGDLVFPSGDYDALCVEIGEASGRNWWCVLFPSLCFLDETSTIVPDESKEKLKDTLSEEEYKSLEQNNTKTDTYDKEKNEDKSSNNKIEIHSAIYDWICKTFIYS